MIKTVSFDTDIQIYKKDQPDTATFTSPQSGHKLDIYNLDSSLLGGPLCVAVAYSCWLVPFVIQRTKATEEP